MENHYYPLKSSKLSPLTIMSIHMCTIALCDDVDKITKDFWWEKAEEKARSTIRDGIK